MTEQPRLVQERYEVGELLGRGGMATVRKARDLRLQRDVAIKELRADLASDSTFQERFRREAHAAGGLNHPNIVSVHDTGSEIDRATGSTIPYIVMELVAGRTLRDILRDGRPILPRKALEFELGVLDALEFSHNAGVVHRDIKPANVMITPTGTVKVMDFGIARAVSDTSSTMTQTAAVIGTAQYLSPEQARGETVDNRSDIYSAGCLLYELLVGRPPFVGESPVSVAYQHVRENPVPPSRLDAEVTPAMDAIVLKALAKSPADRYQTAADMAADIRRLLAGQPVVAVPPPPIPVSVTSTSTHVLGAGAPMTPDSYAGYPGQTSVMTTPGRGIEPERPTRRRGGWVLWTLVGLLAVALVAGGIGLYLATSRKPQVMVPMVKGMEKDAAVALISSRNLNAVVNPVAGPDGETVNHVTEQNPAPNTTVEPGSNVTINVNVGPSKKVLPMGIVGNDVEKVKAQLGELGFTQVEAIKSDTEPVNAKANMVLRVDPAEGSSVAAGQKITLYYATGQATVPNLRTLKCTDATNQAKSVGFTPVVKDKADPVATVDTVLDTTPAPGTVANKGDQLTIFCAVKPITPTTITVTTTNPATPTPTPIPTPTP